MEVPSGIANIPPGDTRPVRLGLTKKGKDIVKKTNKKRLTRNVFVAQHFCCRGERRCRAVASRRDGINPPAVRSNRHRKLIRPRNSAARFYDARSMGGTR